MAEGNIIAHLRRYKYLYCLHQLYFTESQGTLHNIDPGNCVAQLSVFCWPPLSCQFIFSQPINWIFICSATKSPTTMMRDEMLYCRPAPPPPRPQNSPQHCPAQWSCVAALSESIRWWATLPLDQIIVCVQWQLTRKTDIQSSIWPGSHPASALGDGD